MDLKKLNSDLVKLVEKKNELCNMSYSDSNYDDVEEILHDLEDDFLEDYGEYMEEVLDDVHGKQKIDSDVLSPIAYLADEYIEDDDGGYYVESDQGVVVDLEDFPNKICRLALVPSPLRIVLLVGSTHNKTVWKA